MIGAGLLAKNAVERGLTVPPWVKTSLAPGSLVVTDYYERVGPARAAREARLPGRRLRLHHLHRQLRAVAPEISQVITDGDLSVCSVLSGNRNFEGRIHPDCRMNYLASPPLVVAYALAGTMDIDLRNEPLGTSAPTATPVYLRDIWPTSEEVADDRRRRSSRPTMYTSRYAQVLDGDERWRALPAPTGERFTWVDTSTYIRKPPFLEGVGAGSGSADRHRRARACSRCWATA